MARDTVLVEEHAGQNYSLVVSRIREFLQEEDDYEDDYGAAVPTSYATDRVLDILDATFQKLKDTFPKAAVSVSFDGGIRIQWIYPQSSVRLVIPAAVNDETYIYFEDGDNYGTEIVSAQNLADRISWLQRNCRNVETN